MNLRKILVLIFLFTLPFVSLAWAQQGPAPFVLIYTQHVKSGSTDVYEDYIKKVIEAANKIGADQTWTTMSTMLGGTSGTYMVFLGDRNRSETGDG